MSAHGSLASRICAVAGVSATAAVLLAICAQPRTRVAAQADPAASPQFYTEQVKPILENNCFRCHGGMFHRGGLSMNTRASMLKGGHDGAVIVPGDPEHSLLVKLIRHEGPAKDPMPMPPKSKLSDADIETVSHWIKAGAVMPAEPAAAAQ